MRYLFALQTQVSAVENKWYTVVNSLMDSKIKLTSCLVKTFHASDTVNKFWELRINSVMYNHLWKKNFTEGSFIYHLKQSAPCKVFPWAWRYDHHKAVLWKENILLLKSKLIISILKSKLVHGYFSQCFSFG